MDQSGSDLHGRIDKEKLIAEVRRRPLLWQDHRGDLKNKDVTDKLWDEIAADCNTTTTTARKKWKNLKDHFRKEYKKFAFSTPSPDFQNRPKWHYFDSMLFIKDYMTPYRSSSPKSSQDYNENVNVGDKHKFDRQDNNGGDVESKPNISLINLPGPSPIAETATSTIKSFLPTPSSNYSNCSEDFTADEHPRKKKKTLGDMKVILLELEKKKVDLLEREFNREADESPELQFFKSILPHMKNFSQTEKLEVRASILQVIITKQNEKLEKQQSGK